jgi:acetyl esterase/lipase
MAPHADGIGVEHAVGYGHGQALDVYRPLHAADAPVVLLWHGVGGNERDVLEPLARATAALGVTVFVPDWQARTPDGGRARWRARPVARIAQLHSAAGRESGGDEGAIVLAGWSRGGKAAAGLPSIRRRRADGSRRRSSALPRGTTTPRPPRATPCSRTWNRRPPPLSRSGWCTARRIQRSTSPSHASSPPSWRGAAGRCDSAGGGLTVTTCLAAREARLPMLAAIVAFSPGIDHTRTGEP